MQLSPSKSSQLANSLNGRIAGDIYLDEHHRALYSTDASLFEVKPLGVVAPRDEEDVCALVRYAATFPGGHHFALRSDGQCQIGRRAAGR